MFLHIHELPQVSELPSGMKGTSLFGQRYHLKFYQPCQTLSPITPQSESQAAFLAMVPCIYSPSNSDQRTSGVDLRSGKHSIICSPLRPIATFAVQWVYCLLRRRCFILRRPPS